MKFFLRCICIIVILSVMLTIPVFAEEQSTWASAYFGALQTYIYWTSGTQFEVCFSVTGTKRMEVIGVSEILIQRSVNNATWTTVATYIPDDYPQMLEYNTGSCVDSVTYTGSMYYYYRAYVTFYAKSGTGWGKMYEYTSPVRIE